MPKSASFAWIALVIGLHVGPGGVDTAAAEPVKCQRTIAKETAKLVMARSKALQKCEDRKVTGSLPGSTDCASDPSILVKIDKADGKLRDSIAKSCGGGNKTCDESDTGDDADDALSSIGWNVGSCPNFEDGGCTNAIADCDDVATCINCVTVAAVDQAMALYFGALESAEFGSGSDVNKCQRTIGKEATKFLQTKSKELQKCWDKRLKGQHGDDCGNTGAPTGSPAARAAAKIAKAQLKRVAKICAACGGVDKACDGADIPLASIGFVTTCTDVTVPGGPTCGGAVQETAHLVDCTGCVTDFKVDCVDRLTVPALAPYPSECNPATGAPSPLDRVADPVVLTGADVPTLAGIAPVDVVAFRFDSAWTQIPVQVDERDLIDFDDVYNDVGTFGGGITVLDYTDAGTFTGPDSDPTLDGNDEIVFMARDAGGQPSGFNEPAGVVAGSGVEITITDPVGPSPGYVYLFERAGTLDPSAGQQLVDYDFNLLSGDYKTTYNIADGPNPEDTDVTTAFYARHFSDRWIDDELRIFAGPATGIDILDRHKSLFAPGVCGRSEDTFSDAEGAFVINKNGPVRAIRSYVGANSGPLTQRQHHYYERREDITTFLRVHAVSLGIMDFHDYNAAATGMAYQNDLNASDVTIDGSNDTVTAGAIIGELVRGPQGSLAMVSLVDTSITLTNTISYYLDDVTPAETQCTGDAFAYGSSGLWIDQALPNTDPRTPPADFLTGTRVLYYEPPGLSVAAALERRDWVLNPLTTSATAWP